MKGPIIMASTATKSAPALGVTNWLEQVRALAPESRIPYVAIILAEAYERGPALAPPADGRSAAQVRL